MSPADRPGDRAAALAADLLARSWGVTAEGLSPAELGALLPGLVDSEAVERRRSLAELAGWVAPGSQLECLIDREDPRGGSGLAIGGDGSLPGPPPRQIGGIDLLVLCRAAVRVDTDHPVTAALAVAVGAELVGEHPPVPDAGRAAERWQSLVADRLRQQVSDLDDAALAGWWKAQLDAERHHRRRGVELRTRLRRRRDELADRIVEHEQALARSGADEPRRRRWSRPR